MDIREETSGVLLDLLDVEAIARVDAVSDDTSLEGAPQAANAVAATLGNLNRVGESNATVRKRNYISDMLARRYTMDGGLSYRGGPDLPTAASWMWVAEEAGDW